MRKLPAAAFSALVIATVAAFFIAQHLKVATPLLQGSPAPLPVAFDPVYGVHGIDEPKICWTHPPKQTHQVSMPVDYRKTFTTFYLQHQTGHVAVYIVDTSNDIIRTLKSNYDFKRTYVRNPPGAFTWHGKDASGQLAPDGVYYYKVVLLGQDRTVQIGPVRIITTPPRPRVTGVTAIGEPAKAASAGPALISPGTTGASPHKALIHYSAGAGAKYADALVYRTDLPGAPKLVFSFAVSARGHTAVWNGLIRGRPAPAGTYLIGLQAIDAACNVGTFPAEDPPVPGTTPGAGVTVRYLAAEVPNTPVPAGSSATVLVDSRQHPYRWALRRAGAATRVLARGSGTSVSLSVPLPPGGPGLYELAIRSDGDRTVVPLVASAPVGATPRVVLVVVPALTWQGLNPVDDDGDGLPDTLSAGGPIALDRPLANGLPAGFADEADLLADLARAGFHYDLTTDLALLSDPSALLARHRGVVLAGGEQWLPVALRTALRTFVAGGGHVLSLGTGSLRSTVTVSGGEARDPSPPAGTDAFGARIGAVASDNRLPMFPYGSDPLGLFTTSSNDFTGLRTFETIEPPAGAAASIAGISAQEPAITGFPLGRGAVIDVGLPDFGAAAGRDPGLRAVLSRAWRLLGS
jgi:hypothetical protein